MSPPLILHVLLFLFLGSTCIAKVPPENTFSYENSGEFGPYIVEYDAWYRPLPPFESPFEFCYYNTTPGAFTLALRMGLIRSTSVMFWVWEANRGNPVGENAVFALREDGNLILAESDGRIKWQTNTANKGVVGFNILPNGNIVLYDSKNNYLWQSFNFPTDTLLVDQYLKLTGPVKLVSRASTKENHDGSYSMVLEPNRLAMYYKSYLYFSSDKWLNVSSPPLKQVTFGRNPRSNSSKSYEVSLNFQTVSALKRVVLSRPTLNPVLSYMRLRIDGNLVIRIYDDAADWEAWTTIFRLFGDGSTSDSVCQMPKKCRSFGLCSDNRCVSCPTTSGRWTKDCTPPKLNSCDPNSFYYKQLVGVDHYSATYSSGEGPVTQQACAAKCTANCKCLGFFYHQKDSKCWVVNDLNTLIKVKDSTRLAFFKAPK